MNDQSLISPRETTHNAWHGFAIPCCRVTVLILCFFFLLTTPDLYAQAPKKLFAEYENYEAPKRDTDDTGILRRRYVRINQKALVGEDASKRADAVTFNLFDNISVVAVRERILKKSPTRYTWIGRIGKIGRALITVRDGKIFGSISSSEGNFKVYHMQGDAYAVVQLGSTYFLDEAPPIIEEHRIGGKKDENNGKRFKGAYKSTSMNVDNGDVIDVLVVYTADAATGASNNSSGIGALLQSAEADANDSFSRSGVNTSISVVSNQVAYNESGSSETDLEHLRDTDDNKLDNIHALRDNNQADLVVLIVESMGAAGRAFLLNPVELFFEDRAFAVVRRDQAVANHSFAHEIGHLMGARHDWYVDDAVNEPFTFNHGYVNRADRWRTIMAYKDECDDDNTYCNRVAYWSNPDVSYPNGSTGDPTGIPEGTGTSCSEGDLQNPSCDADNRKTLNRTAKAVASFRQSTGGPLWYIRNIGHDDLTVGESGTVSIDIIAPTADDYYLEIRDGNTTSPPKWTWSPDSQPSLYVGSETVNLDVAATHTFEFDVVPNSERENFRIILFRSKFGVLVNVDSRTLTLEAAPSATEGADVALVLDRSGSMGFYRYMEPAKNAASTFVGQMQEGDNVAVVSFSSWARIDFPLTTITSDATKDDARDAIAAIRSGGGTDIRDGILAGQDELDKNNTEQQQGMVLLTDGFGFVGNALSQIPERTDIYTIALGPNSDQSLLNDIASQTGGFFSFAPNEAGLQRIYNAIRAQIAGQEVVATLNGLITQGENLVRNVLVDGSLSQAFFSITWPGSDIDLVLEDPNGRIIDPSVAASDPNISFGTGATFEFYSVDDPVPGNWNLQITGVDLPDGPEPYDITVSGDSDLELDVSFDRPVYPLGENVFVFAEITENGAPVTGSTVTAEVVPPSGQASTITLYDDGLRGDGAPDDGVYGNFYASTNTGGSYTFNVDASGTTGSGDDFTRQASQATVVSSAAPTGNCPGTLEITDYDSDQPGSPDTEEYVELTNVGPNTASLDGCALVFFDGANSASYFAMDLVGAVASNSTYMVGNAGAGDVSTTFPDNTLQNGPDAIALYRDEASNFPDGTLVTVENLITSIVYIDDDTVYPPASKEEEYEGYELPALLAEAAGVSTDVSDAEVPDAYALEQNYPNPFNPATTIRFALPEASEVSLVVYDALGRVVRHLAAGRMEAGRHMVEWNGRDEGGQPVASGVYLYRLEAGSYAQSHHMLLLK